MIKRIRSRKNRLLDAAETCKALRIDVDMLYDLQRAGKLVNTTIYGLTPWFRWQKSGRCATGGGAA